MIENNICSIDIDLINKIIRFIGANQQQLFFKTGADSHTDILLSQFENPIQHKHTRNHDCWILEHVWVLPGLLAAHRCPLSPPATPCCPSSPASSSADCCGSCAVSGVQLGTLHCTDTTHTLTTVSTVLLYHCDNIHSTPSETLWSWLRFVFTLTDCCP